MDDPGAAQSGSGTTTTVDPNPTADYDQDMKTIDAYVSAILDAQNRLAMSYVAALGNFQGAIGAPSPQEATPDLVGAAFKSGLKSLEKAVTAAVKDATKVDLGPLVDMVHAISDEVDRAAKAAAALTISQWIADLRSNAVDAYTQGASRQTLTDTITSEYKGNDEGGRAWYIGGVENNLDAAKAVVTPSAHQVELAICEGWINSRFDGDCMGAQGLVAVQFDDDGSPSSAKVLAPLGDQVAGELNVIMSDAGVGNVMGLDVMKRLSRGGRDMAFEGDNRVRMDTNDDDAHAFLASPDTWALVTAFKS